MEILCQVGFDFLIIDIEHAPIGDETLRDLLIAGKGSDTGLLVRTRANEPHRIRFPLDLGADGVVVPLVNSRQEAERAVAASKYPPEGIRGMGAWRPSGYYADSWAYVQSANSKTILIIQVEHILGVNALDEILKTQGIDGVLVGPGDLSASLNRFPDKEHPEVLDAFKRIARGCTQAGIPFGVDGMASMRHMAPLGATFVTTGIDTFFLLDAARIARAKALEAFATSE
jgi:2-keto-3-deoxy-L-rhamnonate aldolase RhmA